MTREEAKEFYPILQAYAEGKVIECRTKPSAVVGTDVPNEWQETKEIGFWCDIEYRIKPEPKYRPFANAKECWNEMQKHKPFGWVKPCATEENMLVSAVSFSFCVIDRSIYGNDSSLEKFTFTDGTPFGVKVEE